MASEDQLQESRKIIEDERAKHAELQAKYAELQDKHAELQQAKIAELQTKYDEQKKKYDELEAESAAADKSSKKKSKKESKKASKVKDNDIIYLNIGGEKVTTERCTLCQVKDSRLAKMFSGPAKDDLKRDDDGAIFLDYNPEHFRLILEYLRAKKIAQPGKPIALPKVAEDKLAHFNDVLQKLGLSDEIVPAEIAPSEKFDQHSRQATLEESGAVAVNGRSVGHSYVLGKNVYQKGILLKLKLESFQDKDWMFVGVLRGDVTQPEDDPVQSHRWNGSYGWAFGRKYGTVWKNGSGKDKDALKKIAKEGDTVELVLNCLASKPKVSLHFPTGGKEFHIEIPKSQTWRLNVNLRGNNDKIRIMSE